MNLSPILPRLPSKESRNSSRGTEDSLSIIKAGRETIRYPAHVKRVNKALPETKKRKMQMSSVGYGDKPKALMRRRVTRIIRPRWSRTRERKSDFLREATIGTFTNIGRPSKKSPNQGLGLVYFKYFYLYHNHKY